ncbi:MAG: DUF4423 domain-containing protein [Bacteriovoracaceae bacterium]|jgi:uncharacterized protein (TIGR02147 family)|nr:DUF4423 domain-containing protein [Bacteriovoracaceae bacterium]
MTIKNNLSILDFESHVDYLNYVLKQVNQDGSKVLTLERWARRLGYKSPSSLTMILKGQRLPSQELIHSIADDLNFTAEERRYFDLLVRLQKQKNKGKDVSITLKELSKLGKTNQHVVSLDEFNFISDWQHLAIKQLVRTKEFVEDTKWISKKLGGKITPAQARKAINSLLKLKILERTKSGKLFVARDSLESTNDIPSAAIKDHHKQMMMRAIEAIDEQVVEKRQMNSMTFRIDPEKVAEAKEKIIQFLYQFNEDYAIEEKGGEVYQLNLQLFSHVKSE